jgi:archaellum component FlaC
VIEQYIENINPTTGVANPNALSVLKSNLECNKLFFQEVGFVGNLDIFERYAKNKKEISRLEKENKKLQIQVIEELQNRYLSEYKVKEGKFSFSSRRTWTYPEDINKLETNIKELKETPEIVEMERVLDFKKKEAEKLGTASVEVIQNLVFKGS